MIIKIEGPCTIIADHIEIIDNDKPVQAPAYYSFDPHLHLSGCPFEHSEEELAILMKRGNVDIGSALVWSLGYQDAELFKGRENLCDDPIIRVDLEVSSHTQWPAAKMGHLMGLGITDIAWSRDFKNGPHSLVPIAEWMRGQGATIGMAHGQTLSPFPRLGGSVPGYPRYEPAPVGLLPYELPVLAVLGLVDFLAVEQPNGDEVLHPGPGMMWRHLAMAGFPLALVGASDYPCDNQEAGPGTMRTMVPSHGAAPNYETALEDIRAGRGVLSRGAVGYLRLEVSVQDNNVMVEAFTDQPGPIELLLDGELWTTLPVQDGRAIFSSSMSHSAYLSARTRNFHTGWYEALIDGPIKPYEGSKDWVRGWIVELAQEVKQGTFGEAAKEALPYYAQAIAKLDA